MPQGRSAQGGFTLVEVIVSIVIIGILGVGVANFMHWTVQGVKDTAERQQLAKIGWIVSEKLSRELRDALPNSIVLSDGDTCIEMVPILGGTDYVNTPGVSIPVLSASDQFDIVPLFDYTLQAGDRIAVYPYTATGLYALGNPGSISGPIDTVASSAVTADALTVSLQAPHQFLADSPTQRLFVVRAPVRYCFQGGFLYRYSNYGFAFDALTATRTVVGSRVSNARFSYQPGTERRNSLVAIRFDVSGEGSAIHTINQEVQIRNVP